MSIKGLGALFSPSDMRDYDLTVLGMSTDPNKEPEDFELLYRSELPVYDQDNSSQCVAHTDRTLMQAMLLETTGKLFEFSTGFMYGNRRNMYHKDEGMVLRESSKALQKDGVVLEDRFPDGVTVEECMERVSSDLEELLHLAAGFKIKTYVRLTSLQDIVTFMRKFELPVKAAFRVYSNIRNTDSRGVIPDADGIYIGNHAITLEEFTHLDSDIPYFGLLNSWGSEWGNKGRGYIKADAIYEAWGHTSLPPILKRDTVKSIMIDTKTNTMTIIRDDSQETKKTETHNIDGHIYLKMRDIFEGLGWELIRWDNIHKIATFKRIKTPVVSSY